MAAKLGNPMLERTRIYIPVNWGCNFQRQARKNQDLNLKDYKVSFMQENLNPYPDPYKVETKTRTLWKRLLLLAVCMYTYTLWLHKQTGYRLSTCEA